MEDSADKTEKATLEGLYVVVAETTDGKELRWIESRDDLTVKILLHQATYLVNDLKAVRIEPLCTFSEVHRLDHGMRKRAMISSR